jgi:hypothetical protein
MSDIHAVLEERGKQYGDFYDHAMITQHLKGIIRQHLQVVKKDLDVGQQEALDMIAHKIGRIVNGNPNYIDSWVDIVGYAQLVVDRLRNEKA